MKVAFYISITVFVWSLYPLLSVWALEGTNAFTLLLVIQFAAFHGAAIFAATSLFARNQMSEYIAVQKEVILNGNGGLAIFIAGACSAFSHIFFILALSMANKNGVSLIFDIWPIIALFLAPHMIDKEWNKTSKRDYMIGVTALFGVGLVVLSDEKINWFKEGEWTTEAMLGYGMVLVATYLNAILNLIRTEYSQKLKKAGLENPFAAVMVSEAIVRFVSVFFILICIFGMGLELAPPAENLWIMILIGVGIFAVGGGSFTYALLESKNANISLFFYLVPVFAVVWLVAFDMSPITPLMIFGGLITLAACAYLMYDNSVKSRRNKDSAG